MPGWDEKESIGLEAGSSMTLSIIDDRRGTQKGRMVRDCNKGPYKQKTYFRCQNFV